MENPAHDKPDDAPRLGPPLAMAFVVLVMTVLMTWYAAYTTRSQDRTQFEKWVRESENEIQKEIGAYIALMRGGAGLFATSDKVSVRDFRAYVDQLDLPQQYPGIQGFGFTLRLDDEEEVAELEAAKSEAGQPFRVWPDQPRDVYHAIVYLQPLDRRNAAAVGYDMFSDPVRRAAMERARDTGMPAASGKVTLVQEIDRKKQAGFLIYLPVYGTDEKPTTIEQRRAALQGFVYCPFRAGDLLAAIGDRQSRSYIDVRVYDGAVPSRENLLYRSDRDRPSSLRNPDPRFSKTNRIQIAGRTWTLAFSSRKELEAASLGGVIVPATIIVGLLFSLVIFNLARSQARARRTAELAAAKLGESERSLRASDRALRQTNDTLEERVAERTASLVAYQQQLRTLASELNRSEQRERRRLAQVLHDHLQQILVGAKMRMEMLRPRLHDDTLRASFEQVGDLLRQSIEVSRSLTVELSPPILHDGGLMPALHWLGRHMKERHGLNVEVRAEKAAEPGADDVRSLLFQTVRELLFNVVKHGRTDRVAVVMSRTDRDELRLSVEDEGAGFDVEAAMDREDQDGGFGLFSVRERLWMMGGHMRVESAPGRGTKITLLVPLDEAEGAAEEPPAPADGEAAAPIASDGASAAKIARPAGDGRELRILLADDHKIMRDGVAAILRKQPGMEVVAEAFDGEMAVELARHHRPDVVVMDVTMPALNGIEATRRITAELPSVRVVGLSMHDDEKMSAAMHDAGAVAYVTKGGPSDVLIAAIRGRGSLAGPMRSAQSRVGS